MYTCVSKHGCVLCVCVCECLSVGVHCAFLPVSIWITAFELWERVILEMAVNNIIQLLGFFPKTWTYTVHTLTRTWLMGNYTNFHSAFFILTTDTQAIIRCVPLHSYKCSAEWKTCNSISCVYYCYYWFDIKMHHRRIINHRTISYSRTASFPYELRWQGCTQRGLSEAHVRDRDISAAALAEETIYTLFFHSSTPCFN